MAIDPTIERSAPGPGSSGTDTHTDAILQTEAIAALRCWLQDHPEGSDEIKDTLRAHRILGFTAAAILVGTLCQMLLRLVLDAAASAGVDRTKWAVAHRQAVRQLFPAS